MMYCTMRSLSFMHREFNNSHDLMDHHMMDLNKFKCLIVSLLYIFYDPSQSHSKGCSQQLLYLANKGINEQADLKII